MKAIIALSAILCAVSTGCNAAPLPGNDYTVFITPNIPDTMATDTLAALESWSAVVPDLHYNVVYGIPSGNCSHCITITAATTAWIDASFHYDCESDQCIGFTIRDDNSDSAIVYGGENLNPYTQLQMVRHEIGHAFGLVHPSDLTKNIQVMCPSTACASFAPTCIDALNWYAIRSENIPVCVEGK
jgi:hypothetical protein